MTGYVIEVRKPRGRWRHVETAWEPLAARWIFDQHLVPGGRLSVRIRELPSMRVVARATPKADT